MYNLESKQSENEIKIKNLLYSLLKREKKLNLNKELGEIPEALKKKGVTSWDQVCPAPAPSSVPKITD